MNEIQSLRARAMLYVVDDDDAMRGSYGALLISRGYAVRGFSDGAMFLQEADHSRPGCVLLDLRMDGLSGLQVFEAIKRQRSFLQTVFLSGHGELPTAVESLKQGAVDWIQKGASDEKVLGAVADAMERSVQAVAEHQRRAAVLALWNRLTPREKDVAVRIAQGLTAREAARALELSDGRPIDPRTIDTYRARIFIKMDIRSSHELGMLIRQHGLSAENTPQSPPP